MKKEIIKQFKEKFNYIELAPHVKEQLEFVISKTLASQRKEIIKEVTEDLVNLEATGKQVLIKEIIEKIEKEKKEHKTKLGKIANTDDLMVIGYNQAVEEIINLIKEK